MSTQQPWSIYPFKHLSINNYSFSFQKGLSFEVRNWQSGGQYIYNYMLNSSRRIELYWYRTFIGYIFVWFACKYRIIYIFPLFFYWKLITNIKAEFIRIENSKHIEQENILIFLLASQQYNTLTTMLQVNLARKIHRYALITPTGHSFFHHQASHTYTWLLKVTGESLVPVSNILVKPMITGFLSLTLTYQLNQCERSPHCVTRVLSFSLLFVTVASLTSYFHRRMHIYHS
jgi:hypothetical protein